MAHSWSFRREKWLEITTSAQLKEFQSEKWKNKAESKEFHEILILFLIISLLPDRKEKSHLCKESENTAYPWKFWVDCNEKSRKSFVKKKTSLKSCCIIAAKISAFKNFITKNSIFFSHSLNNRAIVMKQICLLTQ